MLVSGGVDSAVLVARLMARGLVLPCYLQCGLSWESVELQWLRRLLDALRSPRLLPLVVLGLPLHAVYGGHWSLSGRRVPGAHSAARAVYLPGRNVLLVTAAAILCARRRISTVALGVLKGNPFGDASPQCFAQLSGCLSRALHHPIRVLAPLRHVTKAQVIRQAGALPLHLTCSCLSPRHLQHCGRCNKCAERRRAFREADVPDPTSYAR